MTTPSMFCWYELVTTDDVAAEKFYADVAGWKTSQAPIPGMRYTLLEAADRQVGGIMTMQDGPPPLWFGYIGVDDVDDYAERVKRAGGAVHKAPDDIPGVGRFAVCVDPQGAAFMLFKGAGDPPPAFPYAMGTSGCWGWNELNTSDWEAAFTFYSGLFGWTKDMAVPMGAMGTYQLFSAGGALDSGAGAVGAMFNSPAPRPMWLFYIGVDDIDAGAARIAQGGGTITNGPHEVPGGAWIVQATDPQGAHFALVGPKISADG